MTDEERENWLNSYSMAFVDRRGRPVKNRDIEKLLTDEDYRTVAKDHLDIDGVEISVSTVFLGLPHAASITGDEECLYETMIFGGKHDQWLHRWPNAAIAHQQIVIALKNGDNLPFEDNNIFTAFLKIMGEEENEGEEWKHK